MDEARVNEIGHLETVIGNIADRTVGFDNLADEITNQVELLSDNVIKDLFALLKSGYYSTNVHREFRFPIGIEANDVRGQLYAMLALKMKQHNL